MNKPTWDEAPLGATHLAMDMDGMWYWFQGAPWPGGDGMWVGKIVGSGKLTELPDWRDTLEERP